MNLALNKQKKRSKIYFLFIEDHQNQTKKEKSSKAYRIFLNQNNTFIKKRDSTNEVMKKSIDSASQESKLMKTLKESKSRNSQNSIERNSTLVLTKEKNNQEKENSTPHPTSYKQAEIKTVSKQIEGNQQLNSREEIASNKNEKSSQGTIQQEISKDDIISGSKKLSHSNHENISNSDIYSQQKVDDISKDSLYQEAKEDKKDYEVDNIQRESTDSDINLKYYDKPNNQSKSENHDSQNSIRLDNHVNINKSSQVLSQHSNNKGTAKSHESNEYINKNLNNNNTSEKILIVDRSKSSDSQYLIKQSSEKEHSLINQEPSKQNEINQIIDNEVDEHNLISEDFKQYSHLENNEDVEQKTVSQERLKLTTSLSKSRHQENLSKNESIVHKSLDRCDKNAVEVEFHQMRVESSQIFHGYKASNSLIYHNEEKSGQIEDSKIKIDSSKVENSVINNSIKQSKVAENNICNDLDNDNSKNIHSSLTEEQLFQKYVQRKLKSKTNSHNDEINISKELNDLEKYCSSKEENYQQEAKIENQFDEDPDEFENQRQNTPKELLDKVSSKDNDSIPRHMINEFADIVKDIQPDANHQNINIFGSSNFALNRDSNSKKFSTKEDRYSNIQRSMSSHQSVIEDKNSLMSKENKSKALSDNKDKSVQNFEKISSNNEQSIQNLSDHNMNVNNNEVTFNCEKEQDSTARLSKISKNKQSNEEIRSKALDMILRQSND